MREMTGKTEFRHKDKISASKVDGALAYQSATIKTLSKTHNTHNNKIQLHTYEQKKDTSPRKNTANDPHTSSWSLESIHLLYFSDSVNRGGRFTAHCTSPVPKIQSIPTRSSNDEEPNVARRRLTHPVKQRAHRSQTLLGMLTSSTLVPTKHSAPIRSTDFALRVR